MQISTCQKCFSTNQLLGSGTLSIYDDVRLLGGTVRNERARLPIDPS